MKQTDTKLRKSIIKLLEASARVADLSICLHDGIYKFELPLEWSTHSGRFCRAVKAKHLQECVDFDMFEVHNAIAADPAGRIHVCPFGITEIAVPIFLGHVLAGVLFASSRSQQKTSSEKYKLQIVPSRAWFEDRRMMLQMLAKQLGALLHGESKDVLEEYKRRNDIFNFLLSRIYESTSLKMLANHINLSPTRTGHVVKDIFKMTLPQLNNSIKLQEALRMLLTTDLRINEISYRLKYSEQSYFSRIFKEKYSVTPLNFQKKYSRSENFSNVPNFPFKTV